MLADRCCMNQWLVATIAKHMWHQPRLIFLFSMQLIKFFICLHLFFRHALLPSKIYGIGCVNRTVVARWRGSCVAAVAGEGEYGGEGAEGGKKPPPVGGSA